MFNGPQISFPRFLRRIFLFKRFGEKYSSEGEACFCVHGRSAPAQRYETTVTIKLDPLKLSIRYKLFIFEIRFSRFIQSKRKYLVTGKFLRTKFLKFLKFSKFLNSDFKFCVGGKYSRLKKIIIKKAKTFFYLFLSLIIFQQKSLGLRSLGSIGVKTLKTQI